MSIDKLMRNIFKNLLIKKLKKEKKIFFHKMFVLIIFRLVVVNTKNGLKIKKKII